jgi:thiamine kinase
VDWLTALQERYQTKLVPYSTGSEARTFHGNGLVFKVYAPKDSNSALREARNMSRAGLGEWVVTHFLLEGNGVLVLKEYPGKPFSQEAINDKAIEHLADFFDRLHQIKEPGQTNRDVLEYRLELFSEWLKDIPEGLWLIQQLKSRLDQLVGIPLSFCHKDPWAGNILLKAQPQGEYPPALMVDWARASGEDPARDLAIFKTGSLDLLGESEARRRLRQVVDLHHQGDALWQRLRLWVPLTYLHDLYWFRRNQPQGFEEAMKNKLPRGLEFFKGGVG